MGSSKAHWEVDVDLFLMRIAMSRMRFPKKELIDASLWWYGSLLMGRPGW